MKRLLAAAVLAVAVAGCSGPAGPVRIILPIPADPGGGQAAHDGATAAKCGPLWTNPACH